MIKLKDIVKYIVLFFMVILSGKMGEKSSALFYIVRLFLIVAAAFTAVEVIYRIDSYFSKKH